MVPCILWSRYGGDEGIQAEHPKLRELLHVTHHWMLGLIIMGVGVFTSPLILGWGTGTTLDDLIFHSFEGYFQRKLL